MKRSKFAREPKTKGALIVEQHRPLMNKLTDEERQQLTRAGLELISGVRNAKPPAHRHG